MNPCHFQIPADALHGKLGYSNCTKPTFAVQLFSASALQSGPQRLHLLSLDFFLSFQILPSLHFRLSV